LVYDGMPENILTGASEAAPTALESKAPVATHLINPKPEELGGSEVETGAAANALNGVRAQPELRASGLSLVKFSALPAVEHAGSRPVGTSVANVVALSEAHQTGFHAKREEFDPEFDNEAETIIADLDFSKDDPPEEVETKLRLIDIYNKRLDSRAVHREYVLSRGLINVKTYQVLYETTFKIYVF
jgi:hypothetical protein